VLPRARKINKVIDSERSRGICSVPRPDAKIPRKQWMI
jgi:hypothetical protein